MTTSISDIAALPESHLPDSLAARLPDSTPGAPWRVRADIVLWWHRASRDARELLPPELRDRPVRPATQWMLVRYADTPVGPYSELIASPVMLRSPTAMHVPFIAVDSLTSVHAGRAHWALPKVLARFAWSSDSRCEVTSGEPVDPGWRVAVDVRRGPLPIPMLGKGRQQQVRAGVVVTSRSHMRALGWLSHIRVDGAGDGPLGTLIRPGRHRGIVMRGARLTVGAPET